MSEKPNKRIAIKPDLYKAIWIEAGQRGIQPYELVDMWLRERITTEPHGQRDTKPAIQISEFETREAPKDSDSSKNPAQHKKKFSEDPAAIQRARDLRATEPPTSWREIGRRVGYPFSSVKYYLENEKY